MSAKWKIDPTHSNVGFKVKHMMFTNVKGNFNDFSGDFELGDEGLKDAKLDFVAKTASVNTNNADRDNHLRSGDFFNVEQYPDLKFHSTSVEGSGNEYKINGDLEILGVKKPVSLKAEYSGLMKDPWGNTKAGLNVSGKINRKEWGLNWNSALETGGVLVSEDVNLDIELQLIKE